MSKTELTVKDVESHNNKNSTWIVIDDNVYDVTAFLNEHPGGEDTLLEFAGKDGTVAFNDVGHSDDARELMKKFKIGKIKKEKNSEKSCKMCCVVPVAISVCAAVLIGIYIVKRLKQ